MVTSCKQKSVISLPEITSSNVYFKNFFFILLFVSVSIMTNLVSINSLIFELQRRIHVPLCYNDLSSIQKNTPPQRTECEWHNTNLMQGQKNGVLHSTKGRHIRLVFIVPKTEGSKRTQQSSMRRWTRFFVWAWSVLCRDFTSHRMKEKGSFYYARPSWHMRWPYTVCQIYQGTVSSRLEYGCTTSSTSAKTILANPDKVQNHALRIITGATKSTSLNFIEQFLVYHHYHRRRGKEIHLQAHKY